MLTTDKRFVENLNRLIDENLDNPAFSVETICQTLAISRSQLYRTLKEQTQLSLSLYIRKRRLCQARHLLTTTDWRISEIADAVGITNPQNFSTYFIEEFKTSPSEFRKLGAQSAGVDSLQLLPETIPDAAPAPAKPTESPPAHSRPGGRIYALITGLALVASVGLYLWQQTQPASRPTQPVGNSLAVLPFINLGAADSSPICEGIMDDVHRSVSLIKSLRVISRSSSDHYKDTPKSIWQIGDELQVANVLRGSVLKASSHIQVKVEIIGTQDDILLWSHTYSAAYADIFTLTDQIVQDVARQLKLTINASPSEKLALARTKNLEAYNIFLQGRQLIVTRTKANVLESIARFDRALAIDSTFVEAYACKAEAFVILPNLGYADAKEALRLGEQNALTAIRLDPTNSTAYAVLGNLYHDTYQWQAAENAFRIALQHNPNDVQANYWYSLLLRSLGRLDEAVHYSMQAVALDPLYPVVLAGHITNCAYANRFDLARGSIENGRGLFDDSFIYHTAQGYEAMCRKEYKRAVAEFQKGISLNPDYKRPTHTLIYCEAKRGNRQRAITFLRDLRETTPRANYERAVVYAGLDQADSCLHYLKKAADGGYLYRDLKVLPVFKPYRSHPVFTAILRQYQLPDK
ncbi:helix-turn-helix domain-containing protein [Spirosoma areae]